MKKGFTLIELLVVITILAILAGAALPFVQNYVDESRQAKAKSDLDEIARALVVYESREGEYNKSTVEDLTGRYLDRSPIDPWGVPYIVATESGIVYSLGPDRKDQMTVAGEADSDDISECYIPKELFITKAQYIDVNGNNVANDFGDYIELTFSRPVFLEEPIGLDFETSNPEKALGTVDIKAEKDPFKARITLIPPIVSHIVIGETCIFPREFIESIYDRSPAHQRLQKFDNMKIEKRKNGM